MIPCLTGPLDGLSLFSATADQRVLLGEDLFLATHMPLTFRRYRIGAAPERWSEEGLLLKLLDSRGIPRGNRVFLLYGAAGTGKSETLRWLQMQITRRSEVRAKALIRIPRTALDPVLIVDAILQHFGESGLTAQLDRWSSLKQKPVSLANQIIWGALGDMLTCDDEIIPLSYKLRPVVEANLRNSIQALCTPDESASPVELLTREQLGRAMSETALSTDLPYDPLLARMREELDQALLGDVRLVPTLRRLSQMALREWGVRPTLLIDDLVQSLNVYASDLLDYFLTLEEGDWDVVIGLTPASFEGTERTRELLQRINQLDTVDDRVTRLFLSDVRGDDSAFLHADTVAQFLEVYLQQFKRMQGYQCGPSCPGSRTCQALQFAQRNDTALAPFNPAVLSRIFRRLPRGKGKPRYLLMAVAELLKKAQEGPEVLLRGLQDHAEREQYAVTDDATLKTFVELYAPEGHRSATELMLHPDITRLLGRAETTTVINVQPLLADGAVQAPFNHASTSASLDPDAEAVRDWLEGKLTNPELLKPLRLSIARWLREMGDPTRLTGQGISRSTGIIRWSVQAQDCDLPLSFDGLDQAEGIVVSRQIGSMAFDLLRYGQISGRAREATLTRIFESPHAYELILQAHRWNEARTQELEAVIQMPVALLAHHMMNVVVALGLLADAEWCPSYLERLSGKAAAYLPPLGFTARDLEWISALWHDNYRIRDNVFRGHALRSVSAVDPDQSLESLLKLPAEDIPYGFTFGTVRLREFLVSLQDRLRTLEEVTTDPRINAELQRFVLANEVGRQLADAQQLGNLRQLVYQVNQLRRKLPQHLNQQLPELLPPRLDLVEENVQLATAAATLIQAGAAAPIAQALQVLARTLESLNGPLSIVSDWITRIEQTRQLTSWWVSPNPTSQCSIEPHHPERVLKQIAANLRAFHREAAHYVQKSDNSDQDRWKGRLKVLEALLPRRSRLRQQYRSTLLYLRSKISPPLNWPLLELTILRVTRYWRMVSLLEAEVGNRTVDLDNLLRFLDVVARGEESVTDLEMWARSLSQLSHREQVHQPALFTTLTQTSSPPSLHDLSYGDLLKLKSIYPHIAKRLILHASE